MADNEILQSAKQTLLQGDGRAALVDDAMQLRKRSVLQNGIEKAAGLLTSNEETKQEIVHYASAGLKTGALFFGGRVGLATTVGLYGLDEIDPSSNARTMMIDGTLGAAKGAAMKGLFHVVGERSWNPALKALGLGVGGRLSETVFTKSSYVDSQGNFAPANAVSNTFNETFSKRAIGVDLATFGLAYGMFKGTDLLSNGALGKSRMGSAAFLGGSFGLVSGANEEMSRQARSGEGFDAGKIAMRGLAMGAVDAVASLPGAGYAAWRAPMELTDAQVAKVRQSAKDNGLWMLEMPRAVRAADGTPVLMPLRGTLPDALKAATKVATDVNHAITLDWNSVRFPVKAGMTIKEAELSYLQTSNSPRRLAEVRRENEQRDAQMRVQQRRAEYSIDALRGKLAREPEVLLRQLHDDAAARGTDWATYAMSTLKHPSEILEFARGYARFAPDAALANLKEAGRFAVLGTEKVWQDAAFKVKRDGVGEAGAKENRLFSQIREYEGLKKSADDNGLVLKQTKENGIVVIPKGATTLREAGDMTGQFAGQINKTVKLNWNERLIPVKPFATGTDIENRWRSKR